MDARCDQLPLGPWVASKMSVQRCDQPVVTQRWTVAKEEAMRLEVAVEAIELNLREAVDQWNLFGSDAQSWKVIAHQPRMIPRDDVLYPAREAAHETGADIVQKKRKILVVAPAPVHRQRQPEFVAP